MIKELELKEAIAECEGERNPNANTCVKLAAYYSLLDRYSVEKPSLPPQPQQYSFAGEVDIPYTNSPFSIAVERIGIEKAFPVMDELMETLYVIDRSLYESVMRKLNT